MKRLVLAFVATSFLIQEGGADARSRWTENQANGWYATQPWLVGSNYTPASAINQLEMWQAATWDPKRIDAETSANSCTVTAGAIALPAVVSLGCVPNARLAAAAGTIMNALLLAPARAPSLAAKV